MIATRLAALAVGLVFGGVLCWSGMSSPEVLRSGLLLENSYLFLFFAAALSTAFVGLQVLKRVGTRSVITGEPLECPTQRPERRHVAGAAIFGVGWAVADVCPGPIATQLGQGIAYGIPTAVGLMLGVWLFLRRERRAVAEPEPAAAPSVRAVTLPDPA